MKKIDVFELDAAAKYIAANNKKLCTTPEDVMQDMLDAVDEMNKDGSLKMVSRDGWIIQHKQSLPYVGGILEISVSPSFGNSYYVDASELAGGF